MEGLSTPFVIEARRWRILQRNGQANSAPLGLRAQATRQTRDFESLSRRCSIEYLSGLKSLFVSRLYAGHKTSHSDCFDVFAFLHFWSSKAPRAVSVRKRVHLCLLPKPRGFEGDVVKIDLPRRPDWFRGRIVWVVVNFEMQRARATVFSWTWE